MAANNVADAKISKDQLEQIMEMLDRDKDGRVTADEFKVPWLKLFPKLKEPDFKVAWKRIDADGDGILSMTELASYYGFDLSTNSMSKGEDLDDDMKILEALQMQAALAEMDDDRKAKKKAEEESEKKAATAAGFSRRYSTSGAFKAQRSSSGVVSVKTPGKVTDDLGDKNVLFIQSCELGDSKAVETALNADKAFTGRIEDDKGEMPLHKLSRYSHCLQAIRMLLERTEKNETIRIDINWQDKQGKTPLFCAAEYGNNGFCLLYMDRGADPFIKDNNGGTVLHSAAQGDKLDAARDILMHSKISPVDGSSSKGKELLDSTDKSGRTALHIAAFKSKEGEMVQLLLKHGADATKEDANGNTGAKLANKTGRRKSKELLEEAEETGRRGTKELPKEAEAKAK